MTFTDDDILAVVGLLLATIVSNRKLSVKRAESG
jgi:hypothetical protein